MTDTPPDQTELRQQKLYEELVLQLWGGQVGGDANTKAQEMMPWLLAKLAAAEQRARKDLLHELLATKLPWPVDVFGEIPADDWHEIDEFAKTRGYRIDTISGTLMRRGWKCFERILKEELAELEQAGGEEQATVTGDTLSDGPRRAA